MVSRGTRRTEPDVPSAYPFPDTFDSVVVVADPKGEFDTYELRLPEKRRLGQARVLRPGGSGHIGDPQGKPVFESLNKFLVKEAAATVDRRFPVVGIGSNSNRAVMARKIAAYSDETESNISGVFPILSAETHHLRLRVLARPSRPGFFAFSPEVLESPSSDPLSVTVAFLDDDQLAAVVETEPNYFPVQISGAPIHLSNKQTLDTYTVFMTWREVFPWGTFPHLTQDAITSHLSSVTGQDVRALLEGLIIEKDEARAFNECERIYSLITSQMDVETVLAPSNALIEPAQPQRYRALSAGSESVNVESSDTFTVLPTDNSVSFAPQIFFPPHSGFRRGFAYVERVDPFSAIPGDTAEGFGAVVQITPDGKSAPSPLRSSHGAALKIDQSIRNGLGVEVQESVRVRQVRYPHRILEGFLGLFGRPQHVLLRRQTADISVLENNSCLIDATAAKILGVDDGATIVLYGIPQPGSSSVPMRRVKAFIADDRLDLRRKLDGGGIRARFPSSDDALGVYPDIPWIFLDEEIGNHLNVERIKLAPILARASRMSVLLDNFRQILLTIALAAIGFAFSQESADVAPLLLIFLGGATFIFIVAQIRHKTVRVPHRLMRPRKSAPAVTSDAGGSTENLPFPTLVHNEVSFSAAMEERSHWRNLNSHIK